jgi:hypothetical protein
MIRSHGVLLVLFTIGSALAGQTYVAPPPPKLPSTLSRQAVLLGKELFERNVLIVDRVEIHNYLGPRPCASCHDQPTPLTADSLAKSFGDIRKTINREISTRSGGGELPPQDPALEALVQYLIDRYRLYEHKMLK